MAANSASVTPETLITIKVSLNDTIKKLKLPFKELTATVLLDKLRTCLAIGTEQTVIFERYSDSFGGFITLNQENPAVFKALLRAAKAKGKLRLKASIIPPAMEQEQKSTQTVAEELAPGSPVHLARQLRDAGRTHRGNGIFQYREARASQQTLVNDEAPVPQPFTPANLSAETRQEVLQACHELAFRTREAAVPNAVASTAWSVYCNICDAAMPDAHYHCSTCDGGDYDLCEKCVSTGSTCPGEDHWLIKRYIKDGKVVTSTTERAIRKTPAVQNTMPGAFAEETKILAEVPHAEPTRTCNNCVVVLPEHNFVTCSVCEDFDLCLECHGTNLHGHHPGHGFMPATANTVLSTCSELLLKAGRNLEHNAFCDGCDKKILGVRHKCLQCPDWDYCNSCIGTAPATHPRHRFAALYEQLAEPQPNFVRHFGIYCDGPLCSKQARQSYIQGSRFKCAVCHDTDFCAACEALPANQHNRTHPLIKFTTPVRNVNITTINEDPRGNVRNMGDKPVPASQNTAIPVQTVAEITPTEEKTCRKMPQPLDGDILSTRKSTVVPATMLNATFVRDSITDGTVVAPASRFTQIWTLRNEGPHVWPAGCSVRYVGGDNMLNVDNGHPASVSLITEAIESSVVAREVFVGEEISFRITLKAPMREGRSISYWRLKAADGTPFGHRLWCDIEVRSTKPANSAQQVPATVSTKSSSASLSEAQHAANRQEQSRLAAMRQHQLRLLYQQQMLRHAHAAIPVEPDHQASFGKSIARSPTSNVENTRMLNAKARMESIRDRILRNRAEQLKAYPMLRTVNKTAVQNPAEEYVKTSPEPEPTISTESAVVPEEEKEVESEKLSDSVSSSQMIFPKLDKESPAGSVIASSKGMAAYVQNEDGEIEQFAVPRSPSNVHEPSLAQPLDDLDDLEVLSLSADSDGEEDSGFLTDEEYDILDASDRETVVSP